MQTGDSSFAPILFVTATLTMLACGGNTASSGTSASGSSSTSDTGGSGSTTGGGTSNVTTGVATSTNTGFATSTSSGVATSTGSGVATSTGGVSATGNVSGSSGLSSTGATSIDAGRGTGGSDGGRATTGRATTGTATTGTATTGSRATDDGGTVGDASTRTMGPDTLLFPFDRDLDGFVYNVLYTGVDDAGRPEDPNNLSKRATMSWDGTIGNRDPGSMKLEIPFSAYHQQADFHRPLDVSIDLSNQVLSLWMKLDSGFATDPSSPGGIVVYIKAGAASFYAQNTWSNIDASDHAWHQYFFDLTNPDMPTSPPTFDAAHIVDIGFYLHTGSGSVITDAGPTTAPPPGPAVFHIDSVGVRPAQ